jgi:DNA modification methylase
MSETFLNGRITLHCGDCSEILRTLPENLIDSVCCDPPYHLTSIVKRFATVSAKDIEVARANPHRRTSSGFMGKQWDGGDIAFRPELWAQVYRVLKPGAHLLAFGGTRTYHRMACAIEDAGFEIRDCVQWLYGSGFPKSRDVSKGIDRRKDWTALCQVQNVIKSARSKCGKSLKQVGEECGEPWWHRGGYLFFETGISLPTAEQWIKLKRCLQIGPDCDAAFEKAEREKIRYAPRPETSGTMSGASDTRPWIERSRELGYHEVDDSTPATPAARQWEGWGTALKPACELIVLARKPLSERTVAANVLKWGTGAINVDGCRVGPVVDSRRPKGTNENAFPHSDDNWRSHINHGGAVVARWPANVIHDGSEEVVGAFPETNSTCDSYQRATGSASKQIYGKYASRDGDTNECYGDSGSAARFFYTSKADGDDRLGSMHPTIKPVDLMQYLVRLITPKGGTVLDHFAGTGTTGEAAFREGMSAVLIERETEYQDDIRRRMKLVMSGPDERARESIKQRMKGKSVDNGPLFDFYDADRDFSESINECYRDIRERVANGGPGWGGWPE